MNETEILLFETAKWALHRNLDGLTHEESLAVPDKGGNSANWVLGHLVTAWDNLLKALGEEPVGDPESMAPYVRGSGPLDPAAARPFPELLADFDRGHERVVARMRNLTADDLAAPAPISPRNSSDETIGSLLSLFAFHQVYHVGQTGILRRTIGKPGVLT